MTSVLHVQLADELCDRCCTPAYVLAHLPQPNGKRATLGLCEGHWRANQVSLTEIPGVRITYSTWQSIERSLPEVASDRHPAAAR